MDILIAEGNWRFPLREVARRAGLAIPRPTSIFLTRPDWAQLHGQTMLKLDRVLRPEKVGDDAIDHTLVTLLDGLRDSFVSTDHLAR